MSTAKNSWSSSFSGDQMSYGRLGALEYYVEALYSDERGRNHILTGWQISRDVVGRNAKGYQPTVTREFVMNVDRNLVEDVSAVRSMVEVMYAMAGYNE